MSVPEHVKIVCSDKIQLICKGFDVGFKPCVWLRTEGKRLLVFYCPSVPLRANSCGRARSTIQSLLGDRFEPEEIQAIIDRIISKNPSICK